MLEWFDKNLSDAKSIVELGAGQFDKILRGPEGVPRIGIERHKKCITIWGDQPGVVAIHGDMRDFEKLLPVDGFNDVVTLIDSLEHIDHKTGEQLLRDLQARFRKILVFTPNGMHEQTEDPWFVGNKFNKHESGWTAEELRDLGFHVVVDEAYHGAKGGALFAEWESML